MSLDARRAAEEDAHHTFGVRDGAWLDWLRVAGAWQPFHIQDLNRLSLSNLAPAVPV